MISSTSNRSIKFVNGLIKKSKIRRDEKLFVVEGIKMFEELPSTQIKQVFIAESLVKQKAYDQVLIKKQMPYEVVSDQVFKSMSDTQTPQGILAVVKQFSYTIEDLLKVRRPAHLLVLERIQDPGNLGTMIRAGEGAGVTGVIMDQDTVDIYNPKVIRSTMGSIYRVPFLYVSDLKESINLLKQQSIQIYAAHLNGNLNYDQVDYQCAAGFLIGNEANGLSPEITDLADCLVRIPMAGQVESLNAAIAASILIYEVARQRR